MRNIVLLLGFPGAGKSSLCEFLIKHMKYKSINYDYCSVGDKLREINQCSAIGELSSNEIINEILKNFLTPKHDIYLLDGCPRSLSQAKLFGDLKNNKYLYGTNIVLVNLVIVDKNILYTRLSKRHICIRCKKNLDTNKCIKCDEIGIRRVDDNALDVIRNRMKIYEESIDDIKEYFKLINVKILEYNASVDKDILHTKILEDLLALTDN